MVETHEWSRARALGLALVEVTRKRILPRYDGEATFGEVGAVRETRGVFG